MSGVTTFTQEIADRICLQMAEGRSLRSICREDEMPAMSTVMKWLREQEAFSEQYAQAREDRADAMFEEMITIADDPLEAERVTIKESEKGIFRDTQIGDAVERARLMVQTRQWALMRMAPKKYGDKVTFEGKVDNSHHWREDEESILDRVALRHIKDKKVRKPKPQEDQPDA